jgi:4'-phosphopantetheinyl transferase EntD
MPVNNTDKIPIDSLFCPEVVTEQADPMLVRGACYPEEEAYVKNTVPKRRQEFAAGRLCARSALSRFGIKDFPLLVGKNREPLWPAGIAGSISHTEGYCGVAVARKNRIETLGLDVELTGKLSRDYWRQICTRQELSRINSLSSDSQQERATLIFSAKECLYKCQYAISGRWLDFCDVEITVHGDIGEFEATFLVNAGSSFEKGTCLGGKYLFSSGYVSTGMWMPSANN